MIKSDYDTQAGRTIEQWETQQLTEYLTLIEQTRDLIRQMAGDYLAAATTITENHVPSRICEDDARMKMGGAMETIVDLTSLEAYLRDRRCELAQSIVQ